MSRYLVSFLVFSFPFDFTTLFVACPDALDTSIPLSLSPSLSLSTFSGLLYFLDLDRYPHSPMKYILTYSPSQHHTAT